MVEGKGEAPKIESVRYRPCHFDRSEAANEVEISLTVAVPELRLLRSVMRDLRSALPRFGRDDSMTRSFEHLIDLAK